MLPTLRQALDRRRHPERYGRLDQILADERLSRNEFDSKHQAGLLAIVSHAAAHSPFYRAKYNGLDLSDVAHIPILTKPEVIAHRDAMLDETVDRAELKLAHTGGSTGTPLAYWYDQGKHELMRAGMMRSYMWSGWRPGERILNLWGAKQDIEQRRPLAKRLADWVSAERTIGAWEYDEGQLDAWAQFVQAYRPVLLQGYASILAALANHVLKRGLRMPRSIRGAYSTAEVLYEHQREAMERAFGAKVFNQYGCREVPNIAVECPHGSQHILSDMVHLESLEIEGEERLLVTSLTNRVMPFIRYQLGDAGRLKPGECTCGRPFPLMEMGHCRTNDLIQTSTGRHIYPSYFIHLLDGLDGIRQFQFVQEGVDSMILNLAADAPLSADVGQAVQKKITEEIDREMRLDIRYVEEIPRSASGKHRFVIRAPSRPRKR